MILRMNSIISGIFVGGEDHQHQRRDAIWPQMHILLIRIHIYDSNPAHGCLILTTKTCQSFSGQIFRFCPRVPVKYKTPETLQILSHGIGLLSGGPKCKVTFFGQCPSFFWDRKRVAAVWSSIIVLCRQSGRYCSTGLSICKTGAS